MKIIGLTGKYCAGKSAIARRLAARGVVEIDVDALGHQALNACSSQLEEVFSSNILTSDGQVDRAALGKLVFGDENQLRTLESIVHPRMVSEVKRIIENERERGTAAVVVNAALLHRMHLDVLCDIICFITVPPLVRYLRARKRDGSSIFSFLRVSGAQKDIGMKQLEKGIQVFPIRNMGSDLFIHRQVDDLCISIGI